MGSDPNARVFERLVVLANQVHVHNVYLIP